jgi:hypothetical protein
METPLTLAAKKGFGTIFGILIKYSVDSALGGGLEKPSSTPPVNHPPLFLNFFYVLI